MRKKSSRSSVAGFSLLELMIAITIIGVLAAVAIQSFEGSVRKANEAAAVATINTIKLAQAKYVADHKGQYGTFRELFGEGYLDKRFNDEKPLVKGYFFKITLLPRSEGKIPSFAVNADPEQSQGVMATGRIFFYSDPENGICFSRTGPATALDETL